MNPLRFPNEYATSKYGGNASIRRSASAVLQTKLQTTLPTELSATTRAAFPTIRDEWLAVGLSTVPANRAEAERGVRLAYNVAGLEAPSLMIWVDSPIAGCVAAAMQAWAQVGAQVWDRVGTQVWDQVGTQVRDQVWAQVGRAVYGQHDAGWLSVYSTLARENIAGCERLVGIMTVARAAGWWWPFERAVILTERPCRLRRDGRGRLHSTDGAAIQYPDGWGVWAWHGIRVSQDVIESDPATWTLDAILGEPNTEIRRVKLERFGGERLRAQATLRQRDDFGKLFEFRVPNEPEPLVFVDVENGTPEADGTFKRYCLMVPPNTQTCHEGVAWTYSMSPREYALAEQT